jgi:small subunit ribosomal protein S3
MGQKINPLSFRVGYSKNWLSEWYAERGQYAHFVLEDHKIRSYFDEYKKQYSISNIKIERILDVVKVSINTSKPASILSKEDLMNKFKLDLDMISKKNISISIVNIKNPNLDASVIGIMIANHIEKRFSYKKSIKSSMELALKAGALGIKIKISGRLNGAEIARSESFFRGSVPLHSISNDISYSCQQAITIYGIIGIKVWINRKNKYKS